MENYKPLWEKVIDQLKQEGMITNGVTIPFLVGVYQQAYGNLDLTSQSCIETILKTIIYTAKEDEVFISTCSDTNEYIVSILESDSSDVTAKYSTYQHLDRYGVRVVYFENAFDIKGVTVENVSKYFFDKYQQQIAQNTFSKNNGIWQQYTSDETAIIARAISDAKTVTTTKAKRRAKHKTTTNIKLTPKQRVANEIKYIFKSLLFIALFTGLFYVIYGEINRPPIVSKKNQEAINEALAPNNDLRLSTPLSRKEAYEQGTQAMLQAQEGEPIGRLFYMIGNHSKYDRHIRHKDELRKINEFREIEWQEDKKSTTIIILQILIGVVIFGRYLFIIIKKSVKWVSNNATK